MSTPAARLLLRFARRAGISRARDRMCALAWSKSATRIRRILRRRRCFTLEALSFQAQTGEIVAILGPNASGKSTVLKLISGALQPLSGRDLSEWISDASRCRQKRGRNESPWCSRKVRCCFRRGRGNLFCRGGTRMGAGCDLKMLRT